MIVYHGSTEVVEKPDVSHAKRFLDFGRAFYVTSFKVQAEHWARRKCLRRVEVPDCTPIVNEFDFTEDFAGLKVLRFDEVDEAWFDFVCDCRNGKDVVCDYDIVIGRVANDDVFKTIQKFLQGDLTKREALEELRYAKPNDQVAFRTNKAVSRCLRFVRAVSISREG